MYLKDRRPVMMNHNPYIAYSDDPRPEYMNQLTRATNFVYSSMRFMKTLEARYLDPEIFHLNPKKTDTPAFRQFIKSVPKSLAFYAAAYKNAYPLDMSQYNKLFKSTRIPRPNRDVLFTDQSARHIVVLRNGHFYVFDVLDTDGNIKTPQEIMAHLKYILNDNTPPPEYPVAVLTSQNRDTWTEVRERLITSDGGKVDAVTNFSYLSDNPTGNEEALCQIDSAVFALCLDKVNSNDPATVSRSFLYGDKSNRWFDKCFNLIVNENGLSGLNFEHSWGDGVAVLRYFNECFKDTTENAQIHPDTQPAAVDSASAVRRLDFKLNDQLKKDINDAKAHFDNMTGDLDLKFLKMEKFGKNYLKTKKLSPDSVMQLAFQMGFYRQHGQTVGTYESCSTAAFRHGRTETIRPATTATKKACELFVNKSSSPSVGELQAALAECSQVHGQLTREAAMGQGFDRHLFGLKHLANSFMQDKLPDIFADPSYAKLNHIILSTSTLSSPSVQIGGFAPVCPDGYGIGYRTDDDYLGCNVTSYAARNVGEFLECVDKSLNDMHTVLEGFKLGK